MRPSKIDVPVALVFFNRPDQFAKVFETVREAAPSRLFLIQDGARENNQKDIENIAKCREVLNGIDWECEINEDFSEENLGCGRRIFSGISNCFKKVDRLIILEDDCVASQSFFPFCEELLEKYKNDERIGMITGMNHLNEFDEVQSDYFFSKKGSIAGWATWKRCWDATEFELGNIANDKEAMRLLKMYQKFGPNKNKLYDNVINKNKILEAGGKLTSWSTQFAVAQTLALRFIIVPRVNLMTNIGLTEESANSVSNIKFVPRGLRPLYRLKLYEMDFPLKHPKYVFNDVEYIHRVETIMQPNKIVSCLRKIESIFLRLIHGDKTFYRKITKKLLKK